VQSWAPAIGLPGDWCFPSFGRGETVKIGWWSSGLVTAAGLKAIVLPAFTLSLFQMTLVLRLVRSQMLEVLRTDYIKFARARGLTNRAVHFRHAPQEHALAGDHRDRHPGRRPDRLLDHHRDGVPVAGHGPALHPVGAVRRHPGDGGLPGHGLGDLRHHQFLRRPAFMPRSTRGSGSIAPRWARRADEHDEPFLVFPWR